MACDHKLNLVSNEDMELVINVCIFPQHNCLMMPVSQGAVITPPNISSILSFWWKE